MAPLSRKRASVYACCALFVWVANQGEVATGLPLKEGAAGSLDSGGILTARLSVVHCGHGKL